MTTLVTNVTIVTMFTDCSGYVNAPEAYCTADISYLVLFVNLFWLAQVGTQCSTL
jgi:hypothetical protein